MKKIDTYSRVDRQFRLLKNMSKKISGKTGLHIKEVEKFVLKQEFFHALLYEENLDLFISEFCKWQEEKMGVKRGGCQTLLWRRIWGAL